MVKPTIYGQAIIFLVFVPLLTFTGVDGKPFSPMAITVMLALAGAFIASLTFVPAMVACLIRGAVSSEARRVWKAGVSTCRARRSPANKKKKKTQQRRGRLYPY